MNDLKNIYILIFLTVLTFVNCDDAIATEENPKLDNTLVTVGPTNIKAYFCKVEVYNPENDTWSIFTEIPINANDDYTAFISHGHVFIFGGQIYQETFTDEVLVFNLVTKKSFTLAPMRQVKASVEVAEIDGFIYVIGGLGANVTILDEVERYDTKTNTWSLMAPMLEKRYYHAVDTWEGKIYVAGGVGEEFEFLNTLEIYDPKTNSWTEGKPMNMDRLRFPMVIMDGNLFAFGGNWSNDNFSSERFNLITQEWTNDTITENNIKWTGAVVYNKKIIMNSRDEGNFEMNPETNELKKLNPNVISRVFAKTFVVPKTIVSDEPITDTITEDIMYKLENPYTLIALGPSIPKSNLCVMEAYNPGDDSWSTFEQFNLNATDEYTPFVYNGKVYVFGGRVEIDECLDDVVVFDLATKKSSNLAPMSQKKKSVGVAESNGYIYVTGGIGDNFTVYDTVERYDPVTNTWTEIVPMLKKRYNHAVTSWGEYIFAAGGINEDDDNLNSVEIYNPNYNNWTTVQSMQFERYKFSILFLDGFLYAIGGNWTLDDVPGERLKIYHFSWSNLTNTIENSVWTSAVVYENNIRIAGNMNNNYEFNPHNNELKKLNPKKLIRSSPISFVVPKTLVQSDGSN